MQTETQKIKCPECGAIQQAEVSSIASIGWGIYIHECEHCGYVIDESDWEEVNNK